MIAGCTRGGESSGGEVTTTQPPASGQSDLSVEGEEAAVTILPETAIDDDPPEELPYFAALVAGTELPSGQECAERLGAAPSLERRPENEDQNNTVVDIDVTVDGASATWNESLAARVTGDFTGTTDQILQWVSCKWGFDENITRARWPSPRGGCRLKAPVPGSTGSRRSLPTFGPDQPSTAQDQSPLPPPQPRSPVSNHDESQRLLGAIGTQPAARRAPAPR